MLNMQNVKDIEIPEGDVRTIHDKDSRLIWGRLAYDTKYAGDTVQDGTPTPDAPIPVQVVTGTQTVTIGDGVTSRDYVIDLTGKNLIDPTNLSYVYSSNPSRVTLNSLDSGFNITVSSGTTVQPFVVFKSVDLTSYVGSTIRMKGTFDAQGGDIRIGRMNADGGNRTGIISGTTSGETISFTVPSDLGSSPYLFYGVRCASTSTQLVNNFTNLILTIDSPIDSYTPYYNYELCKIGDYQDYIYKSGDDWYVHKLIEKLVANGSEEWNRNGNNRQDLEMPNAAAGSASNNPVISTRYVSRFSTSVNNSVFLSAYHRLCVYDTAHANNTEAWETWLASNNTTFYYALATPTDTKITDATLLGQLNAVHEWLTRYGYNATVTGDLPIIISKTNL